MDQLFNKTAGMRYLSKRANLQKRKTYFPFGLYTIGNSDIYGLSVGVGSDTYVNSKFVKVYSNGIRIEPISQALLFFTFVFPVDKVRHPQTDEAIEMFGKKIPNEIVNGINLSCGTNAFADVNGVSVSILMQSLRQTNGVSVSGISNSSFRSNGFLGAIGFATTIFAKGVLVALGVSDVYHGEGLQLAAINKYTTFLGLQIGLVNGLCGKAEKFRGLQIGIFNCAKKLDGIQIGLINKIEKRTLPFINWNFKTN